MHVCFVRNRFARARPFCAVVRGPAEPRQPGGAPQTQVQWFYLHRDLPRRLRGREWQQLVADESRDGAADEQTLRTIAARELLLSDLEDAMPADDIEGAVVVLTYDAFRAAVRGTGKALPDNVFFCRGTYDPRTHTIERPRRGRTFTFVLERHLASALVGAERAVGESSGASADADAATRYCVCGQPAYDFMVCCDVCEDWFHTACVHLTPDEARALKSYVCDGCHHPAALSPRASAKRRCAREHSRPQSARSTRRQRLAPASNASIDDLPKECLLAILALLSLPDLLRAAAVCRQWRHIAHAPGLWRRTVHVDVAAMGITVTHLAQLVRRHEAMRSVDIALEPFMRPVWQPMPQLTSVRVRRAEWSDVPGLVKCVPGVRSLEIVDLVTHWKGAADLAVLADLGALETLSVSAPDPFFNLPAFSLSGSIARLGELRRLRSLRLEYIDNADADTFAFISDLAQLEELVIGLCAHWGAAQFARVRALERLRVLGLVGFNDLLIASRADAVEAAGHLAHILPHLPRLERLIVSSDVGMGAALHLCTQRGVTISFVDIFV
eukprot:Unigene14035_Nuclearia_a/m.42388 Unigene14035_Nuclearia_a/g.42388  ORF Unigene14035_Nuclearia_a/g.42388 Unigene14035_Nuclearia_a/m.42388 type:complete len:556 (+) Unigene14035_Nuclearia_a:105-1772(+)